MFCTQVSVEAPARAGHDGSPRQVSTNTTTKNTNTKKYVQTQKHKYAHRHNKLWVVSKVCTKADPCNCHFNEDDGKVYVDNGWQWLPMVDNGERVNYHCEWQWQSSGRMTPQTHGCTRLRSPLSSPNTPSAGNFILGLTQTNILSVTICLLKCLHKYEKVPQ